MLFTIVGRNACKPTIRIVGVRSWHYILKILKMAHLVYAGVWWISAVHSQHGPGISCSLEAVEARKLWRRLDKMTRDRGRLYMFINGKKESEMKIILWLSDCSALCTKQLCSSCGHLELFSYSFTYNTCLHGNARSYAVPHILKLTSHQQRILQVLLNRNQVTLDLSLAPKTRCVTPICDCSTFIHGRVATCVERSTNQRKTVSECDF